MHVCSRIVKVDSTKSLVIFSSKDRAPRLYHYDFEVDAYSLAKHMCISTSHLHACFHDDLDCAQFICLHAMSPPFVTPYVMLDDNTCWVNHLLNAWFCTNANHICFSKCLLFLLLLKESLDDATLESDNFEIQDDKYLVIVHFYTATPSLSHGDLVLDPRSDLSQGGGDDAEHPTDITMSRAHLASDTCAIYFSYIKVNLLLYTCSLDPFEDGILLDTPLVCMHRCCRSFTDDKEERKRQGTPTPSAREAWKRRRKKKSLSSPERAVLPPTSGTTAPMRHYRLQAVLPLPSGTTARGPVLPPCLCAAAGLWPCIPRHLPLRGSDYK